MTARPVSRLLCGGRSKSTVTSRTLVSSPTECGAPKVSRQRCSGCVQFELSIRGLFPRGERSVGGVARIR